MVDKFVFPDEVESEKAEAGKLEVAVEGDEPVQQQDPDQVEVVDDTPPEDRGRQPLEVEPDEPTEDELRTYSDKVQKRIKELAHARHDERRAKEATQREATEAQRVARVLLDENKRLKEYVKTGEKQYQTTLTASAEAKLEVARRKYKEAHEAYDAEAMLAAQQELTEAQLELAQAKNFKPPVQNAVQTPQEGVYQQPTDQAPPKPDAKTLRWQQRNQWFGQDDEMTAVALIQHKKLVASGIDPRSDEYFSQIDGRMRRLFPEFYGDQRRAAPEAKRPANVVAPAARSSGAKKITLTKTQVGLARKMGLTNEQYAEAVVALEKADAQR